MGAYSGVDKCTKIDPSPGSLCQLQHAPYKYIPTLWVGVVFTSIFAIAFLAHLILGIWPGRFKRGGFMLLASVCAGGEMAGWAARTTSHYDFFSRNPYLVQLICLIISPIFISAANYVALERITIAVGTEFARLGTKTYFILFVSGDILSLVVQAVGGGMSALADTSKGVKRGSNITLAGVIIQVLVTGPFLMLFMDFHLRHYRCWKAGRGRDGWTAGIIKVSGASFISTAYILIRCIYRCAEMAEGWTGRLSRTEWPFCIFDAAMISVAVWIFLFAHPGFYLPLPWSVRQQYLPMSSKVPASPAAKEDSVGPASAVPLEDFPIDATTYASAADTYYGSGEKLGAGAAPMSKPRAQAPRAPYYQNSSWYDDAYLSTVPYEYEPKHDYNYSNRSYHRPAPNRSTAKRASKYDAYVYR